MTFVYTPKIADLFALNWHGLKLAKFYPKLVGFAVLFAVLTIVQICLGNFQWGFMSAFPAFYLVFFVLLHFLYNYMVRNRWNTSEEVRAERTYTIDEKGIHVEAASFSGSTDWSNLVEADFVKGVYFLKSSQNLYNYFPAEDVPERAAFVNLVSQKTKVTDRFKKSA